MIREVKIKRGDQEFALTLNEIQAAYDAMLWATLYDEVEWRLDVYGETDKYAPYIDEIVEGLRQEMSEGFSDDVISDMLGHVLEDVEFEHDLESEEDLKWKTE